MQIDRFVLGDFQTNCYVLRSSEASKNCLIIDPGFGVGPLIDFLEQQALSPQAILLTHGHCDHIAGVGELREHYPELKIYISKEDWDMMTDDLGNLSMMMGSPLRLSGADGELRAGETMSFDSIGIKVLATPGHTPGGLSFYVADENVVFSGDALFEGSIGRHDFPGGDYKQLIRSIKEQLLSLDDQTQVLSGHGEATTIGREKRTNPFLR